ncbi:MAG: hypothetical protein ABIJ36_02025 [Patescibacteria group bacterium]
MTKAKKLPVLLIAVIIYISFVLFFFLGLEIYKVVFYAVLGKPEELEGLLLLFTGAFASFISGFVGSVLALVSSIIYSARNLRGNPQRIRISIVSGLLAYALFVVFIILTALVIKTLHTPCPNCYK